LKEVEEEKEEEEEEGTNKVGVLTTERMEKQNEIERENILQKRLQYARVVGLDSWVFTNT